jgi:hypothetical protein
VSTQLSSETSRKQPASVYTIMLLLSMLFMIVAVIAMWLELNRYAPEYFNTGSAKPNVKVVPSSDMTVGIV